ncbi:site-specific DNA-methyltransferase [Bacillus massilinigeriensis]|uniref:site-specific DNA-methyltransferase n=1 Tax=Bacillus massilionigeriensis TaxID=1805475 RepID=UPI00096B543A|nr:site-specific DNA-methyltransferase [Bacillus massilionigeriensis]
MEKLDGKSLDLTKENINALKQLFPEVVTEGKIDFEKLKFVLGEEIETNKERYEFTWHGKAQSLKLAQTPSTGTLRPDKESSKNWDTTENLYIEGDNLEVLKLLQKSYFGKVKMIYIDPPYNTGHDFVYKDDFRDNVKNYKQITNQTTKSNSETNGRYHTDWLNMMYPRLKLARNLLREDGVIFISIDNNEIHNLRKACDEIFGQENFVEEIIWKNKYGSGAKTKAFIEVHEYILCYSKTPINNITSELGETERAKYVKKDEKYELRGGYRTQPLMTKSLGDRPNLVYPVYYNGVEIWPEKQWVWSKERMEAAIKDNLVEFKQKNDGTYTIESKAYLKDVHGNMRRGKPLSLLNGPFNQDGTSEIRELFNGHSPFDFVKPSKLIRDLLSNEINDKVDKEFIVVDFFSGSSTTAHAVMKLNAEDNGKRKFIMIQLPELTDEKSEAYKAGYKNICEIGKERIRRAGDKVVADTEKTDLDIGFKVFKLDSSNVKLWDPDNENLEQNLFDLQDNIKKDRSKEDLLFEILLKIGVPLTTPIEEVNVNGKVIYNVGFGSVLLCLEDEIELDTVRVLIKLKPEDFDVKVIFKETGFLDDSVKTNAIQTLKKNGITDVRSV